MDVSVILPVLNERDNLRTVIPSLAAIFKRLRVSFEIVVVDGGSRDGTRELARELGAQLVDERRKGYGGALATGLDEARGDYVLTLDADMSHEPAFVAKLWRVRDQADITIASRYMRGGAAYAPFGRRALSRLLNFALRLALALPARDVSSGFRLYRRQAIEDLALAGRNIEVLEEILVKAYVRGYSIQEVPFTYFPRSRGSSHARVLRFGADLMRAAARLRPLRNSPNAADYHERAFYSLNPARRFRERRRHRITIDWARGSRSTLHIGCDSSITILSLNNPVAIDVELANLRFLRRLDVPALRGCALGLPFKSQAFDCVIYSEQAQGKVSPGVLAEIERVLGPEGILIATSAGGRRANHLEPIFEAAGFTRLDAARVARDELISSYRKNRAMPASPLQRVDEDLEPLRG